MRRAVTLVAASLAIAVSADGSAQQRSRERVKPPVEEVTESLVPRPAPKQNHAGEAIARAAAAVREAWLAHDAAKVVAGSPELVVELPGADPSAPLSRRQAAALLSDFFSASREVELIPRHAKEVQADRGYAELLRRYRVNGTQDVRVQSLYLGYRRERQGWVLVELRAVDP